MLNFASPHPFLLTKRKPYLKIKVFFNFPKSLRAPALIFFTNNVIVMLIYKPFILYFINDNPTKEILI